MIVDNINSTVAFQVTVAGAFGHSVAVTFGCFR